MISRFPPDGTPLSIAERDALMTFTANVARHAEEAAGECSALLARLADEHGQVDAERLGPADLPLLEQCMRDYASALRARGLPPEEAIVQIKHVLSDRLSRTDSGTQKLTRMAVTWAIKGYYRS
jgi:hypothetical protein